MKVRSGCLSLAAALMIVATSLAVAQNQSSTSPVESGQEARQAANLDLEQLANMDVKVTSASRQEESLFGAPAAIFVLTGDDIRRGGFTTLPDALRMVPGLYVVRTNSRIWQVSTRGFSDLNNNKMLVLIDGRSVYSPQLGSVYWETLDLPLEDIERVEIIRGPGGTLWGDNAVNGVINVITKKAARDKGLMVSTTASEGEGYTSTVLFGGRAGSKVDYRLSGRASYWEPLPIAASGAVTALDESSMIQIAARIDWAISSEDFLTISGGSYDGRDGVNQGPVLPSSPVRGNHVLMNWKHTFSPKSHSETTTYCDWFARFGVPGEARTNCDVEFQHSYRFKPRQTLIWGGTFFTTSDDERGDAFPYVPELRRTNLFSGFGQYELSIIPNRLRVLAGSKVEHNDYTGVEYQPQVRAVWTPDERNAFWTAVSRAVRTPTRNNSDLQLTVGIGLIHGLPAFQQLNGDPNLQSEEILAYELGYRVKPVTSLSFDLALYYNKYERLIVGLTSGPPQFFPDKVLVPSVFANGPDGQSHGAELSAKWQPFHGAALTAGVTETRGDSNTIAATARHLFNFQSRFDLPHRIELDSGTYYYSALGPGTATPAVPIQSVPAFTRFDLGTAWHFLPQWTFSVWGRNLNSSSHLETRNTTFNDMAEFVPREVVFKVLWQIGQK